MDANNSGTIRPAGRQKCDGSSALPLHAERFLNTNTNNWCKSAGHPKYLQKPIYARQCRFLFTSCCIPDTGFVTKVIASAKPRQLCNGTSQVDIAPGITAPFLR